MICLVTDRRRLAAGAEAGQRLIAVVEAAAEAGVDIVQVRERDLDDSALAALVCACVSAVRGTGTKVVVNDRADVAFVAGANGVHLRADSYDAMSVRRILPGGVIGLSIHTPAEVMGPSAAGVDYFIFGTLFESRSKTPGHALSTLDALGSACRRTDRPVLAIGGMTVERAAAAAAAGAAGIAAIGLFVPPDGISARAHFGTLVPRLRTVFDRRRPVP